MVSNQRIYLASAEDIPILVRHHRLMFEEIWHLRKLTLEEPKLKAMDTAYHQKLSRDLNRGPCNAWVYKDNDRPIASGAISIASGVPNPDDDSCWMAYLHSIFTETAFRGKGIASKIVEEIIGFCRTEGITRLKLNTSEAGRPVYTKLGFQDSENVMSLSLL